MRRLAVVVILTALVGCSDNGSADTSGATGGAATGGGATGGEGGGLAGPLSLTFLDDHNIPTGFMLDGVEMGGLSGLWIDPTTGQSWAICDDQLQFGPPRFYELAITLADELGVTPQSFTSFQTGNTPAAEMDAEGIARTPTGELYISTEGDTTPLVPPALIRVDAQGTLLEELTIDAKFIPDAAGTQGVRRNQGFEALTLSPSGATLFTATERALVQDGPPPTFAEGNRCRILRYDVASGQPTGEFFYVTDPIPPAQTGQLGTAGIGMPELLALSEDDLLVLERAAVQVDGMFTNTIRVYEVSVTSATDVSGSFALPANAVALQKRLVLDLNDILPQLDPAYPNLDNVEAMSFGPTLPDGEPTLVLLSDNNFGVTQRTAFFSFVLE